MKKSEFGRDGFQKNQLNTNSSFYKVCNEFYSFMKKYNLLYFKKQVQASSIAEVVIALSIIALCFGIASLVFIRSLSTTAKFEDIRNQTEIQSKVLYYLTTNPDSLTLFQPADANVTTQVDENNDSLNLIEFKSLSDRVLWNQQTLIIR
jgi:hypothetical protein